MKINLKQIILFINEQITILNGIIKMKYIKMDY